MIYSEFDDEYRSPGYYLGKSERIEMGMDPDTGEYLEGHNFNTYLAKMTREFDELNDKENPLR